MTLPLSDAQRHRNAMYNANELKIGLFGANCSSARTATRVPERWMADWADTKRMAQMADEGGIDFLLPIGRWKGYGGTTDLHGITFETITWATGLLAATKRITVFGTVHAPLFHPILGAKQMVTADHVGEGRFGLNIVAGWNEGEFEMFGVEQREHDTRYDYAAEWLKVMHQAWDPAMPEPFDFDGRWFKLKSIKAKPKPYGGTRPVVINAGASPAGQAFALRNSDAFFTSTSAVRIATVGITTGPDVDVLGETAKRVSSIKAEAREVGRDIEVYTQGQVICRPTTKEAEEYYRYANVEMADWGALERMLELRGVTRDNTDPEAYEQKRHMMALTGIGGNPFVGSPDKIAEDFANLTKVGLRGLAVSLINYVEDAPYFIAEVLPRLKRMGLRG